MKGEKRRRFNFFTKMTVTPLNPHIISFDDSGYPEFFRRHAHQLLAFGYQDVRHEINSNTGETTITIKIYEGIKRKLESFDLTEDIANRLYSVKSEDPKLFGNKEKFIDIVIEDPNGKPRNHYTFEAKRLKRKSRHSTIEEYCSERGLIRLVVGSHTYDYPESAMIGYMQSDDAMHWSSELKSKFDEDNAQDKKMFVEKNLEPQTVISEIPNEWCSVHRRDLHKHITLFHIFLDCCDSTVV